MDLLSLRNQIDAIDNQLLRLLNERMNVVKNVGELKKHEKSVIYRPEREKSIIDRLTVLSQDDKGTLNHSAIEAIFLEIFAVSRNLELPEKVAFLGPEGSYTHQAAENRFGAMSEYIPLKTIKSVFDNVETERVRFGVVPIENNQEGTVAETIDQLCYRDVKIVAELPLSISFSLASNHDDLTKIKKIYSKDIAFRQCRNFIEDYFDEDIRLIQVSSTSRAAEMAANEEGAAAICSHIAAKLFQLPIRYNNIEDSQDNTTRFLIIAKDFINQTSGKDKTSILAKIGNHPGDLANFLEEFRQRDINLTKIESRPAKMKDIFNYWFVIDFDGHYKDDKVQDVMRVYKDTITFLGSYVKMV
ncbi:prephenate dehydratase [Flammeovirga agarivorans]|uniref:Bifunctional chorismate mutase/prephenate dehydratase n=1 Tax=Flammeovirga agarivorans TaxID=2726742 RepID=A0A7X8SQA6_9BACT|nr:prephenate dehydratase [Flammeovirga agarivorans]NLR94252.1 prephenate dehydratase [Flammeovirga agarivorans]